MTSKSTARALLLALAALCNTSVSAQTDFQCHADNVADSNQWYADATAANENGSAAEVINLSNQKSLVDTAVGGFLTDPALSPCDADIDAIVAKAREDLAVIYTDSPTVAPSSTPTVVPTASPTAAPTPAVELDCFVAGESTFLTCAELENAVTVGCAKSFSTEDLQPYYDGLGCGDVVTEGTFNLDTAVAVFDPNDVTPELDGNTTDSDGSLAITLGASAGGGGLLLFIILVAVNHMQKGDDKTSTGDNEKGDVENQIAVLSSGNELEGASSPQLAGNELGEFTEDPNIGSAVV